MKVFTAGILALAIFIAASAAHAVTTIVSTPAATTELWEGKALTAHFRVGICYTPKGNARGVLILRHRNGNEDTYHLYGTLKNGRFNLTHSSGHVLNGEITGSDSMKGKAYLSNGMSMSLSGKRYVNVPLAAEDCAPVR